MLARAGKICGRNYRQPQSQVPKIIAQFALSEATWATVLKHGGGAGGAGQAGHLGGGGPGFEGAGVRLITMRGRGRNRGKRRKASAWTARTAREAASVNFIVDEV